MTINNLELVRILVYVLAGLFFLQSLMMVIFFFIIWQPLKKLEYKTITTSQRIAGQIRNFKSLLSHLEKGLSKLPLIESSASKALDFAIEKFHHADRYAESTLKRSTIQIEEVGRKIDYSLRQFNRQVSQLDRSIRNPTRNVSAVLQGISVGFRELFKSTQISPPATHSAEDDAFI